MKMPDGSSPIMMPMQPDAAAQQMLIEQVRRLTDGVERFNVSITDMREQLARMQSDHSHMVERRGQNEARITKVEDRVDVLESWQSEQRGERSFLSALIGSPIAGWIGGIAIGVFAALEKGIFK